MISREDVNDQQEAYMISREDVNDQQEGVHDQQGRCE